MKSKDMWRIILSSLAIGYVVVTPTPGPEKICQYINKMCSGITGAVIDTIDNVISVDDCGTNCLSNPVCTTAKYNTDTFQCELMNGACPSQDLSASGNMDLLIRSGDSNGLCADDGWEDWSNWSNCTVSCDGGTQTRTRVCIQPSAGCDGDTTETISCNISPCPVDGGWGEWSVFDICTVSCGTGTQTRTRSCNNPAPSGDGALCAGLSSETQNCNQEPCPVDGGFGTWSGWSACSQTCGDGIQTKTRPCDNPAPANDGAPCHGTDTETQPCKDAECPVDGNWGIWLSWGACSVTCDDGQKTRSRVCDSPAPDHSGLSCPGNDTESQSCNDGTCSCTMCTDDGGTCLDTDGDGTNDTCVCPEGLCSLNFSSGCNIFCGPVGDTCEQDSVVPCWDRNAYCGFSVGVLQGAQVCLCKLHYETVYTDGQPTRCYKKLSRKVDPGCGTCFDNGGICYDKDDDNIADGCSCPATRASINESCDALLFSVECNRTTMSVCYQHNGIEQHIHTFNSIGEDTSYLYVKGHFDDMECHLVRSGDDYCITFTFGVAPLCGLLKENLTNHLSYATHVTIQKNGYAVTDDDLSVYAYCRIDKMKHVSSGGVGVFGNTRIGTEGVYTEASVTMSVVGLSGKDLAISGMVMGDLMKIIITLDDDAGGIFTAIRADVCLITDQYTLARSDVQYVPLIVNGCPASTILTADKNFVIVGGNKTEIATGLFNSPQFSDSQYIFVHCAIHVCLIEENCSPKACDSRRRRSLSKRTLTPRFLGFFASPEYKHEVIEIRTRLAGENLLDTNGENDRNPDPEQTSYTIMEAWMTVKILTITTACVLVICIIGLCMWYAFVVRVRRKTIGCNSTCTDPRHLHSRMNRSQSATLFAKLK